MIREHLAQGLIDKETLILIRVLFAIGHPRATLEYMNVYALNNKTDRATFWECIRLQVASEVEWCIGGDFTMIEPLHNSSNSNL